MRKIQLFVLSLLIVAATGAQAQEWCFKNFCCFDKNNIYAKIFSGANFLQNTTTNGNQASYKAGYIVAGSVGYYLRYGFSLEAEYAFRRNNISTIDLVGEGSSKRGHFQTSSYMANLLWDLPLSSWRCCVWNIQPFLGAGIGYDFQQMHSSTSRIVFNQKWNNFAWQVMGGLSYPLFRKTDITLEYKFHQGGSNFNNHSVGVGLVYNFGCSR